MDAGEHVIAGVEHLVVGGGEHVVAGEVVVSLTLIQPVPKHPSSPWS